MQTIRNAEQLLAADYALAFSRFTETNPEEIRLRLHRKPTVLSNGSEHVLAGRMVEETDFQMLLEKATNASIHTATPQLLEGFLNYKGLRIGVCGTAVIRDGKPAGFRRFSSIAIRLPRERPGICDQVRQELTRDGYQNTLILAPPGGGKTTALRDLIRGLSIQGYRIGVADDRNELAAEDEFGFQFDLGTHTDVLTGFTKAEAVMMLLRGMNPQIIAMDEISRESDMEALKTVWGRGVRLLASAHAGSVDELFTTPAYRALQELKIFRYYVSICGTGTHRQYAVTALGV